MPRSGVIVRGALIVALVGGAALASRPHPGPAFEARPVPLDPTDPARTTIGELGFLGALDLRAADPAFGGLSGLAADGDDLLAISDRGSWVRFRPVFEGGRLVGAGDLRLGPLRGPDGALGGSMSDAESLARWGDRWVVGFERVHRLVAWTDLEQPGEVVDGPPTDGLPNNGGFEAVAALDGGLLALAEGGGDATHRPAWWGRPGDWAPLAWTVSEDGFEPTSAAELPGGGVVVVERRYRVVDGVRIRVHLWPSPATSQDRRELARLEAPLTVDNVEAATTWTLDGRTVLLLASDDNFRDEQRTLLMAFALPEPL